MTQTTTNSPRWNPSGMSLDLDQTVHRMEQLKSVLKLLDIRIHPQSRISLYEQRLQQLGQWGIDNAIRDSRFDWTEFTEGNRDVMEVSFICEKLVPLFPEEMKTALTGLVSGAPLPSGDANTFARDMQFQLYLTARFVHSEFQLTLREPDLVFIFDGAEYGIAAKRLSSAKQLEKRIKEAIVQLEKTGIKGMIALSLDRLLVEEAGNPRVIARDDTSLSEAGPRLMEDLLRKHAKRIAPLLTGPNVIGLLGHLVVPGVLQTPGNIGITEAVVLMPRGDDDPESSSLIKAINSNLKSPAL